jgi:hypothetical protein
MALAICAVTAALLRQRTTPRHQRQSGLTSPRPPNPGMTHSPSPKPRVCPPIQPRRRRRALAGMAAPSPGLSAWYRKRTQLARDAKIILVS